MASFEGIYPAAVTPFDDDENLDLKAFAVIVDHLYNKGIDGLYICGSTGEGVMMNVEERKQVAECAVKESRGRGKVIVHVGSVRGRDTFELARHAESIGADAISSVPPLYYSYSYADVKAYYREIASSCALPLFVYYIPILIKFQLTPEFMGELLEIDTVKGVKFTDYNHFMLNTIAEMTDGRDFTIFNGYDQQLISGLSLGACAGIGSTYNYQPRTIINIYRNFREGNWQEAIKWQNRANRQIEILMKFSGIPFTKEMLKLQGLPAGRCRSPFRMLSDEELAHMKELLEETGMPE